MGLGVRGDEDAVAVSDVGSVVAMRTSREVAEDAAGFADDEVNCREIPFLAVSAIWCGDQADQGIVRSIRMEEVERPGVGGDGKDRTTADAGGDPLDRRTDRRRPEPDRYR